MRGEVGLRSNPGEGHGTLTSPDRSLSDGWGGSERPGNVRPQSALPVRLPLTSTLSP
ncbi:Exodeoxyribonuclease 7 large subunit (fragment) [Bradyrhizobium sp. ORS 285]